MELITEYFEFINQEINNAKIVYGKDITFRQIDVTEGYIKGKLFCYAGFSLHIAEYVT